jgi:hypothetical protein
MRARLAGFCIPAGDVARRATFNKELIMKKIALVLAVLVAALVFQSFAGSARAQNPTSGDFRTWISATGDDANGCDASDPCRTFNQALSLTLVGGEVSCLGPGPRDAQLTLTITGTVTIDCHGTFAGILTYSSSATNAIVVNAPSAVVTLRGLNINGYTSSNGIVIQAAAVVNIEDCVIENFSQSGISVTTSANTILNVRNTTIRNAANGISFAPTGGAVNGSIDRTMIAKMSGNGITTSAGSVFFTVTSSVIANAAGVGVHSGGAGTVLGIDSSSVSNNRTAFATNGGVIRISRNVIYDNTANYSIAGGVIATSGDNKVAVNGSTVPNGSITQQ